MAQRLNVVLAGPTEQSVQALARSLAHSAELNCSTVLTGTGAQELLSRLSPLPDVLVLHFDAQTLSELAALPDSGPESRPPLIVVGPAGQADAVRLAMRAGARDFLANPVEPSELIAALDGVGRSAAGANSRARRADVITVIGAAGGVGTSLIACNLAVSFATEVKAPTLLMDLELNAAPLTSLLDLTPERGLPAALAEAAFMDNHALQGYVVKHRSGLHLIGAPSKSLVSAKNVDLAQLPALMSVIGSNYRYIVADASHTFDDLSVAMLGMASTIVLVMQQSVVQLRRTVRILGTLCNDIGLPRDRVSVVVNRRTKHSTVALEDIRRALSQSSVPVVPNDYKAALASIDSGVPLLLYDRSSAASKSIVDLQRQIAGEPRVERPSLLRRALPIFSGD